MSKNANVCSKPWLKTVVQAVVIQYFKKYDRTMCEEKKRPHNTKSSYVLYRYELTAAGIEGPRSGSTKPLSQLSLSIIRFATFITCASIAAWERASIA